MKTDSPMRKVNYPKQQRYLKRDTQVQKAHFVVTQMTIMLILTLF